MSICKRCNNVFVPIFKKQRLCANCRQTQCKYCGKFFEIADISHPRKYCSHECYSKFYHQGTVKIICKECGKEFEIRKSFTRRNRQFCSNKCRGSYARGRSPEEHPSFKGGIFEKKVPRVDGSEAIYLIARSKGKNSKGKFVHRIVAEKAIGRELKRNEIVHHVNGDSSDNNNNNLIVCDGKYHAWLHHEMARRYMAEHFSQTGRPR